MDSTPTTITVYPGLRRGLSPHEEAAFQLGQVEGLAYARRLVAAATDLAEPHTRAKRMGGDICSLLAERSSEAHDAAEDAQAFVQQTRQQFLLAGQPGAMRTLLLLTQALHEILPRLPEEGAAAIRAAMAAADVPTS